MIRIEDATPVANNLKALLYGPPGCGKTIAALTFPRVLLVDAEHGSDLYGGQPGIAKFQRAYCKTLSDLLEVIGTVEKDNGKTWDTLVIDPITVFYDVEMAVASNNHAKDLAFNSRAKINGRMGSLYTRLTNLNVHVVVTAHQANEYVTKGESLEKVGVKPDADRKVSRMMNFVLRLNTDHSAEVEKSRGVVLGNKGKLSKVTWEDVFAPIAAQFSTGALTQDEDESDVVERQMDSLQDKDNATAFFTYWRGPGRELSDNDILAALGGIKGVSEWTKGRKAADEAVNAYIDKMTAKPTQPVAT